MKRKQIYDRQWQRLARRFLKNNRRCRFCGKPSAHVDHITPTKVAPWRRLDPSNWQALCHDCHNRITTAYEKGTLKGACDVDGTPLDPWHPWNQGTNAAAIQVSNAILPPVEPSYAAQLKRMASRKGGDDD
jgi:hypothetical protein